MLLLREAGFTDWPGVLALANEAMIRPRSHPPTSHSTSRQAFLGMANGSTNSGEFSTWPEPLRMWMLLRECAKCGVETGRLKHSSKLAVMRIVGVTPGQFRIWARIS
jgi:hypothetical protein